MRNRTKFLGIIAAMALIGFSFTACGGGGNGGPSVSIPTIDVEAIPVPIGFFDEATGASAITATTPDATVEEVALELFLLAEEVMWEFDEVMWDALWDSIGYDGDPRGTHWVNDFLTPSDESALYAKGIIPPWAGAITMSVSGTSFRTRTNPAIGFDFTNPTDIAGRARIAFDIIERETSTHYIEETANADTHALAFIIDVDSEEFAGKVVISIRFALTFRENRNTGAEEYIDNYSQALFRAVFYDQEGNHTRTFQLTGEDALDFMWYSTPEFEPTAQRHSLEGARSGRSARSRLR